MISMVVSFFVLFSMLYLFCILHVAPNCGLLSERENARANIHDRRTIILLIGMFLEFG